jgi:hypothetical protein
MKTRRATLLAIAVVAAISAVAPAAANAGGTYVWVKVQGAGKVHETSPVPPRVNPFDCSSGPAGTACPDTYWETDVFKDIVLKAEPAENWRFDGWDVVSGFEVVLNGQNVWLPGLNCVVRGDTCTFRSGICVNCVSRYAAIAKFVRRDDDGDGDPRGTDCNDDDKTRYHGAIEVPGNMIDENCDGFDSPPPIDVDVDDDGFPRNVPGAAAPFDCDDNNRNINPGARDIPDNGIDEDCKDGDAVNLDRDGDGYGRNEPGAKAPFDCDDNNKSINPGAHDVPDNGVDEDCKDGDAVNLDRDGDGYGRNEPGATAPFDCDDTKDGINPGMAEVLDNGVDENCDGIRGVKLDRDGDGYDRDEPGAKAPFDCNDANGQIHPGAVDIPRNVIDEDCDRQDADYPSITSEVRYAARSKRGAAIIRRLWVARPPDRATVQLRCKGGRRKGCTFRRRRVVAAPGTSAISFASDLRKARLRRGAVLEVWITRSGMRGKLVRLTVRRGGKVTGVTLCVPPGSKTPTGCPPG